MPICRTNRPAKTLYLLHGRSHNYSVWTRYTSLEQYAKTCNTAIIMPEVNRSFYSNMKYGLDYQTCSSLVSFDYFCRDFIPCSVGPYYCQLNRNSRFKNNFRLLIPFVFRADQINIIITNRIL